MYHWRLYDGETTGIPIKALKGAKVTKTVYFVKYAPQKDGSEYIAASKPVKVMVTSEQKKPNFKIDTKKKTIKAKAGTIVNLGGIITRYDSKGEVDLTDYKGKIELWTAATAKKPASVKQVLTG